jgi:hypothetical protein
MRAIELTAHDDAGLLFPSLFDGVITLNPPDLIGVLADGYVETLPP